MQQEVASLLSQQFGVKATISKELCFEHVFRWSILILFRTRRINLSISSSKLNILGLVPLIYSKFYSKGRTRIPVDYPDFVSNKIHQFIDIVFYSSSKLNTLALVVFLTLAYHVRSPSSHHSEVIY
jgi:hypothetical protein